MVSEIEIVPFEPQFHDDIKRLIREQWRPDHPILSDELFYWQYRGYGHSPNFELFRVAIIENSIVGFRAIIPGLYQVPYRQCPGYDIIKGGSAAMWLVDEKYRGKRLGYRLQQSVMEDCRVFTAVSARENTSAPIFLKFGCSELKAFRRYVIPIEVSSYRSLLQKTVTIERLTKWIENLTFSFSISPCDPDARTLSDHWKTFSKSTNIFSLYRNEEFWRWRYIDNPFFRYYFFWGSNKIGDLIVIGRIEVVQSKEYDKISPKRIFRIVEIIPQDKIMLEKKADIDILSFFGGIFSWVLEQQCFAIDFQVTSSLFGNFLQSVGFKEQNPDFNPPECSLVRMFSPVTYNKKPLNCYVRIMDVDGHLRHLNFENSYIVKTEADADRPNKM